MVITDHKLALMNTLAVVFSNANGYLCKWHVSNTILVNVKSQKTFVTTAGELDINEEKRFMTHFAGLIVSPSISIYQD